MRWLIANVTVYGEVPVNVNAGELSVKDASRHEQKIKMNIESVGSPSIFDTGRFPDVLNKITGGASLEEAEAYAVMSWVLSGSASPSQIAALLIALKSKGETVEEMSGFVLAMLDVAERVNPGYTVLDTCGTGGDGLGTINISTIVAFIAAGAGAKVCKHGGRSASSLTGSADLLEELGVTIDLGAEGVSKCIDEVGMGFCFAPVFHPAMRYAAPVRKELGIPTVFNLLGPLANPALHVRQLVGVPSPDVLQKVGQVLSRKGCERAMVVHGDDGMDELSLCASSTVLEITDGGEITHFELYPPDYGFKLVSPEEIKGGTAKENAEITLSILAGEKGHYRDSVVLNASAALMVADLVDSFEDGIEMAISVLDNGDAQRVLDGLVSLSTRLAST